VAHLIDLLSCPIPFTPATEKSNQVNLLQRSAAYTEAERSWNKIRFPANFPANPISGPKAPADTAPITSAAAASAFLVRLA
jgi:hypothetical protein